LKHRLHGPGEGCSAGNIGEACGRWIDLNQIQRAGLEGEVTGDRHRRARDARPRRECAAAGHSEAADSAGSREKVCAASKEDGVGARNAIAREASRDRTVVDDGEPGAYHAGTAGTVPATSAASAAVAARDRAGIVQGAARQDGTIAASPAGPTISEQQATSATVATVATGERAGIEATIAAVPTITDQQAAIATVAASPAGPTIASSATVASVAADERAGIAASPAGPTISEQQATSATAASVAASPTSRNSITSSATVASVAAGERAGIAAGPAISEQQATSAAAASVAAIPARAATDASPRIAPIATIATGHPEAIICASVHDRAVTARAATTAATARGASTAVPAVAAVAADRGARDRSRASVPRDTAGTPTATPAAMAQVARASTAAISAGHPNSQRCLATGTAGPGPPSRSIPTLTTVAARHCS
jgi:hypothetical protein